jgi:predicted enzyme related to lactoylglutathione lyase
MPNRVVHFEIISPEAEKIQRFFADVFDWAINTANPMNYGMVDTGAKDYGIQGGIAAPGPFGSGHVTFYIEVDDVDKALERAVAAGGTIAMPKINIGGAPGQETILAQFTDPLGNRYGLSQRAAQPAAAVASRKPAKKAAKAKAKPKAKVKAKPKAKPKAKAKKRGRR